MTSQTTGHGIISKKRLQSLALIENENKTTRYVHSAVVCCGRAVSKHRTQILVAESSGCEFGTSLWHFCPRARHIAITASLHPGEDGYLWEQRWFMWFVWLVGWRNEINVTRGNNVGALWVHWVVDLSARQKSTINFCYYYSLFFWIFYSTDVPECASNPCQNGGQCQEHFQGYTCQCSTQYQGRHCQVCKKL